MRIGPTLATVLFVLAAAAVPARADGPVERSHVTAELVSRTRTLKAGTEATLGIRLTLEKDWHVYWKNAGDSGEPPKVKWALPPGYEAGPIRWPAPKWHRQDPLGGYIYEGEVLLPVTLRVPRNAPAGEVEIVARVDWVVCAEECEYGDAELTLRLPVGPEAPGEDSRWQQRFAQAEALQPKPLGVTPPSAIWAPPRLTLRLPAGGPWSDPDAKVEVYPEEFDVLHHFALPRVTREGDDLVLEMRTPDRASKVPQRLTAVLGVSRGTERRAFAVDVAVGRPAERSIQGDGPTSLWLAALLAFAGGLILNLMPCVLPVLSIKVLGFVQQAQSEPQRVRRLGYAFGVGVLVSFWALAGLLLVLRAAGQELGWGFQLQEPAFVAAMVLLLFGVALNLFGLFEVGAGLAGAAGRAADRTTPGGYLSSFSSGVLATLIATPCTAPFMGPAVGYALTVSPVEAVATFTALGVGMAVPYVLLSMYPAWLRWVPRPGPWMVTFRQAMAFPVLGAVLYFAWVFGLQVGADGTALLLAGLLLLSLAGWLFGRPGAERHTGWRRGIERRIIPLLIAACAIAAPLYGIESASAQDVWEPWRPGSVEEHRAAGRTVFVDFTAGWCFTCQVNERTILASDAVRDAVREQNAVLVKADWTKRDPQISRVLQSLGRASVPTYVVYAPDPSREPEILPTAITPGIVVDALRRASAPSPSTPR